ncbi:hypothetical protein TELCIR_03322 [Teladorsagia circumcincta]|uniref:Uncharacterized protein n=1 Tax=Teladorsagia circumcincta TaxID=45464 RepID=A0A2G9UY63_TELCI|nr:hypothetical protein TELCIR_03322 [Teladorsagia circumcincta]
MTSPLRVLFAIAVVLFTLSVEQMVSAINYGDYLDGGHAKEQLRLSKRWSRLEPSIRFIKRMVPESDSIEK